MTSRSPQGANVPSGSSRRHVFALGLALLVVAIGGGCNFGQTGVAPPANRIFLPTGLAADPGGRFVYVVNSNSDLRFNAGTIVAVDLSKADQLPANPPMCTKTRFSRTEPVPDNYCCVDMLDRNIVNCNEPQFIQSNATVAIASFGGAIQLQNNPASNVRRIFVAVRAEPSITYADVTVGSDGTVSMLCQGPHDSTGTQQPLGYCDDNWKVRRPGGATPGAEALPQEPHVLWLDEKLGALFVGHLMVTANRQLQGGGVSSIDICNPQHVAFAGWAPTPFPLSLASQQSVAAISPPASTAATTPPVRLYAGARNSAAMSALVLRTEPQACDPTQTRDLTLVPSDTFYASAFLPHGADVRGILFSDDGTKAWMLQKNAPETPSSPAALVQIDRRATSLTGKPANTPMGVVQVCSGPTEMQMHDAGRGNRIFITCYDDGEVYVIDPATMTVTAIVDAGIAPTSLVFSKTDPTKAYVASFFYSHLSVIDFAPGSRTENRVILRMGLPHGYGE